MKLAFINRHMAAETANNNDDGDNMKLRYALMLMPILLPLVAHADNFPTVDRVEYVLECIKKNGGKQEYLYKCSCAIDRIAQKMPYEDYVEASTAARYQGLGGERGAVFRDPDEVKTAARKYKAIQGEASKACHVS